MVLFQDQYDLDLLPMVHPRMTPVPHGVDSNLLEKQNEQFIVLQLCLVFNVTLGSE